jgi:hypothetical protein
LRSRFLGVESLFRGCAVRRRKGHKIAVKIQSSHRNAMSREPPAFRSGLTPGFRSRIQNRGTITRDELDTVASRPPRRAGFLKPEKAASATALYSMHRHRAPSSCSVPSACGISLSAATDS